MSTTAASDGARPSWLLEALSSAPMVEALERIAAIAAAERAERGRWVDDADDDSKPTKPPRVRLQPMLGTRPMRDAPAPLPNVELKRGTDAVLFEVVIRWQLHDALEQLGARLGLGRAELLEELVWLGWWCADQHELGREITARPAPQEPEELRLSRRFKRQLPTPASPAEQRGQRRAATHPKGMDALEHALERLASELPLKQRASK